MIHKSEELGFSARELHEDYEGQYWTEKFGVTKAHLDAAVKKVGVRAKDVEMQLKAA